MSNKKIEEQLAKENLGTINIKGSTGNEIYSSLSSLLGGDKAASEFLNRAGFVGIEYPAEYQSGGRKDGKKNYVVFNEKDMKITDHVRFLKDGSGTIYGYTVGGKIYLSQKGLNPNTPIHEYTHLWANAMMQHNRKEWENIKEMLKGTPVWNEVINDKEYEDIKDNEDDVASEVLSRISGRENSKRIVDEMQKGIDEAKANGDLFGMAEKVSVLQRIKDALNRFWNWVVKDLFHIHFSSIDEVTDRVLYDMTEGTNLGNAEDMKRQRQVYVEDVNEKFNEELDDFKAGSMKGKFSLGSPSEILKAVLDIPDSDIEMTQSTLSKHLKKHGLTTDDIKDLVDNIQNPMMVYEWGEKAKSAVIITNITKEDGRKITVALKLERNGKALDVNEVASVHGKGLNRLIPEMNTTKTDFGKDNLKWVDKEKALEWLSMESVFH